MNAFEQNGYWWLPEKSENKHSGKLSFSHEAGLILETLESFSFDELEPGKAKSIGVSEHYPVIKGVTRTGKYITLVDCDSNGLSFSYPGFPSEKFLARYALEESVPAAPDLTSFYKARVQFTYLPDWVGVSGIKQHLYLDEETKTLKKLEVTYEPLYSVAVDLGHTALSISESYSLQSDLVAGTSLKSSVCFEVEPRSSLSFEEWHNQLITPLQDFLTLATRRPNAITELSLFAQKDGQEETAKTISQSPPIKVFYRQSAMKRARPSKSLWKHDMLFDFQDIKEQFSQLLSDWLIKRDELSTVMDLFFAVENSSGAYLANEFLNLTQALEIYHRERLNTPVDPELVKEHEAKKRIVVANAPEEYREWLTNQLTVSNQVRLQQRLAELFGHTDNVISKLVTNKEIFSRKVTKTRNYLTHYSRNSAHVMDGEELFRATQILSYVLQLCFLLELGLSEESIVKLFERNQKFLFTASQIRQAHYWE